MKLHRAVYLRMTGSRANRNVEFEIVLVAALMNDGWAYYPGGKEGVLWVSEKVLSRWMEWKQARLECMEIAELAGLEWRDVTPSEEK